jgi:hypothetical protein
MSIGQEEISRKLPAIIELARLAPSVHNTQPWSVTLDDDKIVVAIDAQHKLSDGDPTGRQTVISLGIFSEAVSLAACSLGFEVKQIRSHNDRASIELNAEPRQPERQSKAKISVSLLKTRATDRSIYKLGKINRKTQQLIVDSTKFKTGAKVWVITERDAIDKVASWTAKGIGVALSNPAFRLELSRYLVLPWSKKKRGISVNSLYIPKPLAVCEPLFMKHGLGLKSEVALEKKRWLSASAVVCVTTKGDVPAYWFDAGRVYLHAALAIEATGLSQATSAAAVEASTYHEDVEALLKTEQRLQAVLRIGYGSTHRAYSPRLSSEELITSN